VGGTAVDTFWFEPGAQVAGINGGGAPAGQGDWLDYANYSDAVTVNLATGVATGVTGTVSNIQNVFGGNHGNTLTGNAQGNILIGGDGADTIIGGSGRSLLIGGRGSDTIGGGADDDIVIGGYTSYGSAWNEAALMSFLAEWQSADSYATRISSLRSSWHSLSPGTTVFDDGSADQLTGGGGMDWFMTGVQDSITDYQGGETVN
jgi:Ca2+-binding RTX toxin-like protein